jgi:radical SAM superfamily enzyme YgiQ (UPF0313 family)
MADRTPEYIASWLDKNLHRFDNPPQFLGTEPGAARKPWDQVGVRWLIAASWPYYHSTGNQSIPAVCVTINNGRGDFYADRFYLPETPRDLRQLERAGIPVFGIESKHQLLDFDVVGTSISYAVLWLNFCKMIRMSGVPLRWRDREADPGAYPMLVAGGQACRGPGFMEPVADCIFLGEVEDEPGNGGLSQVNARIAQFKAEGVWRNARVSCYERLAREFNYLFFPRFVETSYRYEDRGLPEPSKQVSGYVPLLPGMRMPFRARTVRNLDDIAPLTEAPLLYADPRMGAGDLEVGRGCDAWCSFCALGWNANPPRERSVAKSVEHAKAWQRNMGSTELSPFSPDFPMHRQKKRLLAALLENVNSSLDVTAMRIDDFIADDQYVMLQAHAGADGVTLGLEGNSARMRDLVGKGTTDKDVEEAVIRGIRAGFRKFKLFMITNLPGEEPGDVLKIVDLARRLAAIRDELGQPNVIFQFSWTPLLIESQTPFQWFAPTPPDHMLIKVAEQFRELNVQFKIGTKAEINKVSLFQLCQRASREVGEAITDVIEELDTACWGGVPKDTRERLEDALRRHGFRNGLADAFDERFAGDLFGWEYINMGVSWQRMWDAYAAMVEFLEGTDAETYEAQFAGPAGGNEWVARCDQQCGGQSCGVCGGEDLKLRAARIKATDADIDLSRVKVIDQDSVALKVRVRLEVPERNRFVTREHWKYAVRRAAYRAQADLEWKVGIAKKTVQLASEACKHRDWACGTDYAEFGLTGHPPGGELYLFMQNIAAELAPWLTLGSWQVFPPAASVRRDAALALWDLEVAASPDEVAARLRDFAVADYVKLTIRSDSAYFGAGTEEVNAKDWVSDLWLARDGHRHVLRMLISAKAGPYALYAALMGKPSWIEAAARPAIRRGIFAASSGQPDLLLPVCDVCGQTVPAGLISEPYDDAHCPRCADEAAGIVTAALRPRSRV